MFVINCLERVYNSTSDYLALPARCSAITEKVKTVAYKMFPRMAPEALFHTMNKMNEYPVLNDLVAGVVYTGTGSYMMYKSCKIGKMRKGETFSDAAFRRTCALMGALCATYGVYTLTSLVAQLFAGLERGDVSMGHMASTHPYVCYDGPLSEGSTDGESLPSEDPKVKAFLENFLKCPDAKAMYDKMVSKEGAITIRFEDSAFDETLAKAHGYWDTTDREIVIDRNSDKQLQFHILIYEMINASQDKDFLSVINKAANGDLGAMAYAKGIERIEYETTKRHCRLTASCIAKGIWSSFTSWGMSVKDCGIKYRENFETRWLRIKDRPHTKIYLDYYEEHYTHCKAQDEQGDDGYCQVKDEL